MNFYLFNYHDVLAMGFDLFLNEKLYNYRQKYIAIKYIEPYDRFSTQKCHVRNV